VKISWCSTLSISVLVKRMEESSYLRRLSLRSLLMILSSTKGRTDPAGFEPTFATVTECCVSVTPRALSRVWATVLEIGKRFARQFSIHACRTGTKDYASGIGKSDPSKIAKGEPPAQSSTFTCHRHFQLISHNFW
jgi:hypothetical protein